MNNPNFRMVDTKISYFEEQISRLIRKYPDKPAKLLLKSLFYNIKAIFLKQADKRPRSHGRSIRILFNLHGGIGDCLLQANFICYFINAIKADNIKVDVSHGNIGMLNSILSEDLPCLNKVFRSINIEYANYYDLKLKFSIFPRIKYCNLGAIKQFAPHILKFIYAWNDFENKNCLYLQQEPCCNFLLTKGLIPSGFTWFNQADIGRLLGIKKYILPLKLKNSSSILKKFGLYNKPYIVFCRESGHTDLLESTKLWPRQNYIDLAQRIKKDYPNVSLVEIGTGRYEKISKNMDFDLVGKTDLEELKVLLKEAALHIDTEGGNVHFRRALNGGKSIVLFGPGAPEIFGYKENINISTTACPIRCGETSVNTIFHWQNPEWCHNPEKCICMRSITVDMVYNEIKKFLNTQLVEKK
jgi:hypothetical protein